MSTAETIVESAGALQHWALEPVLAVDRATSGTMNDTFLITTEQRRLVLRKHRRTRRDQIEFEQAVIDHARKGGIPTPTTVSTPGGTTIVEHNGSFYSLFTFARGQQVAHGKVTGPRISCAVRHPG